MIIEKVAYRFEPTSVGYALRRAGEIDRRPVAIAVQQIEQLPQRSPVVGGDHRCSCGLSVPVHQYDGLQFIE